MSLAAQLKRSIRANRSAIKRALPFQGFDHLSMRRSFEQDMRVRGLSGLASQAQHGERAAARLCSVMRLLTLRHDRSVTYMPATGAP